MNFIIMCRPIDFLRILDVIPRFRRNLDYLHWIYCHFTSTGLYWFANFGLSTWIVAGMSNEPFDSHFPLFHLV